MKAIAASSLQNSSSTMTPANSVTSLELWHTNTSCVTHVNHNDEALTYTESPLNNVNHPTYTTVQFQLSCAVQYAPYGYSIIPKLMFCISSILCELYWVVQKSKPQLGKIVLSVNHIKCAGKTNIK